MMRCRSLALVKAGLTSLMVAGDVLAGSLDAVPRAALSEASWVAASRSHPA